MPFTTDEVTNINAAALKTYLDKGTVFKQNVANKPMLQAFDAAAGKFPGGNLTVSFAVKAGQGTGSLVGYTGDDQVAYYNPTGIKRTDFPWKEHHIGMVVTHTELKIDGIDVGDDDDDLSSTSAMDGRENQALANLLDEKNDTLGEDYAYSLDTLIHGDGTSDAKALAGIKSLILDSPSVGTTGGIGRVANSWWRNRAATAANGSAGGQTLISSASTAGGVLIEFLEKEWPQINKFKQGSTNWKIFVGSDFRSAYLKEQRANGYYTQTGWSSKTPDGSMNEPEWKGIPMVYDPTLDTLGLSKRMYMLDMGKRGVRLLYMDGQKMKKHNPSRPYDRYVMYNGITTTAVMIARQLNTSAVYDIA